MKEHERALGAMARRTVPPLLVAGLALRRGRLGAAAALLAIAAVLLVVGLALPATARHLDAFVARVADRAMRIVSVVLSALLALAAVPISAVLWVLRWDPLARDRRGATPGWSASSAPLAPDRTYLAEPRPTGALRRTHGVVASLALPALLIGALVAAEGADPPPDGTSATQFTPFVFADEPWIGELKEEFDATGTEYDPVLQWRSAPFHGRYLNVDDGIRRSYQPARSPHVVWFFGGSTLFGFGQRDEHTIASEVSRLAEAGGHPIRVVNFGTTGYVNWQETMLLAQRLSAGERPDLIVFLDGANELTLARWRAEGGDGRPDEPSNIFYEEIQQKVGSTSSGSSPTAGPDVAGRRAARIYARGVEVGRRLAASYGIPIIHIWQPSLWTKDPWSAADHRAIDALPYGLTPEPYHETAAAASPLLPAEVVDLSHALDGMDEPMFYDLVHTNELGARRVAEAIEPVLRPTLEELDR